MNKLRAKRVDRLKLILENENPKNCEKVARDKLEQWTFVSNVMVFALPLLLTLVMTYIASVVVSSVWRNVWTIIATTVCMALGFYCQNMASNYSHVCNRINDSTNKYKKKIAELEKVNQQQTEETSLRVAFMNNVSSLSASGGLSIQELSKDIVSSIFSDCRRRFPINENLTVNLYLFHNNKIKMVGHHQGIYSDTFPYLLDPKRPDVEISDPNIKDYYCVKLFSKKDSISTLGDWEKIVHHFNWRSKNKKQFTTKIKCKSCGVTYNQYIGLRVSSSNRLMAALELISHNDAQFACPENLDNVGAELLEAYRHMLVVLLLIAESIK